MAVRSSDLPDAVKDTGEAAINTWYKLPSKILNTFNGVAALIFVARSLGKLKSIEIQNVFLVVAKNEGNFPKYLCGIWLMPSKFQYNCHCFKASWNSKIGLAIK